MRRIFYVSPLLLAGCADFQRVLEEVRELSQDVAAVAPEVIGTVKPAVENINANPSDPTGWIAGVGALAAAAGIILKQVLGERKIVKEIKANGK